RFQGGWSPPRASIKAPFASLSGPILERELFAEVVPVSTTGDPNPVDDELYVALSLQQQAAFRFVTKTSAPEIGFRWRMPAPFVDISNIFLPTFGSRWVGQRTLKRAYYLQLGDDDELLSDTILDVIPGSYSLVDHRGAWVQSDGFYYATPEP